METLTIAPVQVASLPSPPLKRKSPPSPEDVFAAPPAIMKSSISHSHTSNMNNSSIISKRERERDSVKLEAEPVKVEPSGSRPSRSVRQSPSPPVNTESTPAADNDDDNDVDGEGETETGADVDADADADGDGDGDESEVMAVKSTATTTTATARAASGSPPRASPDSRSQSQSPSDSTSAPPTGPPSPATRILAVNGHGHGGGGGGGAPNTQTPSADDYENGLVQCGTCGEGIPFRDPSSGGFTLRLWDQHRDQCRSVVFTPDPAIDALSANSGLHNAYNNGYNGHSGNPPLKKRRAKRTEEERIEYLRTDPYVAQFEPYRVLCGSCKKWIRLRPNSTYCSIPWDAHRKSCLSKKARVIPGARTMSPRAIAMASSIPGEDGTAGPGSPNGAPAHPVGAAADNNGINNNHGQQQHYQSHKGGVAVTSATMSPPSNNGIGAHGAQQRQRAPAPSLAGSLPTPPSLAGLALVSPHSTPGGAGSVASNDSPYTGFKDLHTSPPALASNPMSLSTGGGSLTAQDARRRNAEQRAAVLRSDPLLKEVEPSRVFCGLCGKWVQLRQDSSYCAYPWHQHRAKCLARYQRRQDRHAYPYPPQAPYDHQQHRERVSGSAPGLTSSVSASAAHADADLDAEGEYDDSDDGAMSMPMPPPQPFDGDSDDEVMHAQQQQQKQHHHHHHSEDRERRFALPRRRTSERDIQYTYPRAPPPQSNANTNANAGAHGYGQHERERERSRHEHGVGHGSGHGGHGHGHGHGQQYPTTNGYSSHGHNQSHGQSHSHSHHSDAYGRYKLSAAPAYGHHSADGSKYGGVAHGSSRAPPSYAADDVSMDEDEPEDDTRAADYDVDMEMAPSADRHSHRDAYRERATRHGHGHAYSDVRSSHHPQSNTARRYKEVPAVRLADLDTAGGRLSFISSSVKHLFRTTYERGDELTIGALVNYLNAAMPQDKHEDFDVQEVTRATASLVKSGAIVQEGDLLRPRD